MCGQRYPPIISFCRVLLVVLSGPSVQLILVTSVSLICLQNFTCYDGLWLGLGLSGLDFLDITEVTSAIWLVSAAPYLDEIVFSGSILRTYGTMCSAVWMLFSLLLGGLCEPTTAGWGGSWWNNEGGKGKTPAAQSSSGGSDNPPNWIFGLTINREQNAKK